MKLPEFLQDSHTVIFLLILVLLVSVWVSRTYRNGGFSRWIAPSEGYGTGIIEGLTQATPYVGDAYTYDSNPPATAVASAAKGLLLLNRCSRIKNTETTFRVLFTPTVELRGLSGETPAKIIKITIPKIYIQNTAATGLSISMKDYAGTSAAAVNSVSLSGTSVDSASPSNGIAVDASTDANNCVITYTIQTSTPIPPNKQYALELSGVKWVNAAVTPAAEALVTLESNAEPSGAQKLVVVNLYHASDATKRVKIFDDTTFGFDTNYLSCRKITTESPTLSPNNTGTATTFTMNMMLTNGLSAGDHCLIQLPYLLAITGVSLGVSVDNALTSSSFSTIDSKTLTVNTASTPNPYGGGQNSIYFKIGQGGSGVLIAANATLKLTISGIQTPPDATSNTSAKIRTFKASETAFNFTSDGNVLDAGEFTLSAITKAVNAAASTGTPTSSGTATDGTTYVTSSAASVLISNVKEQMNWAIQAQKDYEAAYQKLRSATSQTAKNDAQDAYDKVVAKRNRLIASHPDSWYDGANWRYGDDGYIRKCIEPSTLSTNEGNCQNIFKMDASGNLVKTVDGNNILLMKKCPWKCNNAGQSGSDACRIDTDCLKVTRWAMYLPDGTQIEKNLLGTSTRSSYDDIASASSSSALSDDDIYKRGITRNFKGYGKRQPGGGAQQESSGLFGSIRDATGNIIRGIGNWIDPNDPNSGKRTAKHNAYYYEDGSPAATAYLGMYNGQGYEEESPFTASKPMNYYYTTNYYYTDGEAGSGGGGGAKDGSSNMPGATTKVLPYEQNINL